MYKVILGAFLSVASTSGVLAYDGAIDIAGCPTSVITVEDVASASGWGGHISTRSNNDGYGDYYAECHLTGENSGAGVGNVTVLCYDGYLSGSDHVDQYAVELGPRSRVKQVEFKVTRRGVHMEAIKHSTSGYTSDENDFVISAFFPLREGSGFCRESTLYYEVDGVLSGTGSRDGSGYSVTTSVVN